MNSFFTMTDPYLMNSGAIPPMVANNSDSGNQTYRATILIREYVTPIICVSGIFTNILSILVLSQKDNRQISCFLYFIAIAITDNILLFGAAVYQILTSFAPDKIAKVVCIVVNVVYFGSSTGSSYLLIWATFDR